MGILVRGVVLLAGFTLGAQGAAHALPPKLSPDGRAGFAYGDAGAPGNNPTSERSESKLFYTPDGRWWAVLGVGGAGLQLHELVDHVWQSRVALPGSQSWDRADALFVSRGNTLFVSAREDRTTPGVPRGAVLYRLRYRGGGTWSRPRGPTRITASAPETVTIARDSKRRMWATWEDAGNVRVRVTRPGRFRFRDVRPPGGGLLEDDISAVTAYGGRRRGKIGVMWSNQATGQFRFAWRRDGDRLGRWRLETAYGGGLGCDTACSDDHINLKVAGGSVYAVVKTSRNDLPSPNPEDPLVVLLRRDAGRVWTSYPVSPVRQNPTRPVLLLAPQRNAIWVFARASNDDVVVWESPFASPGFNSAAFSSWTSGQGSFNDPSTTRQRIPPGRAAVVVTSKEDSGEYWHNELLP